MTTILAVRSLGMLLCDTQSNYGTLRHRTQKAFCVGVGLYAAGGDAQDCELFLRWVVEDESPDHAPSLHESFAAVKLMPSCMIQHAEDKLIWENIHEDAWAIGTGREFVIGALAAGASPAEAMVIAAQCDIYTGEPIQCFTLDDTPKYPQGVWLQ